MGHPARKTITKLSYRRERRQEAAIVVNSRSNLSLLVLVLLSVPLNVLARNTDEDVVRYAKALDVASLDETLHSEPLAHWLRAGPPQLEDLRWIPSSNCDEKFVGSRAENPEMPLCVKVSYTRGPVQGWLMIVVGTTEKGVSGKPSLKGGLVDIRDLPAAGIKDEYIAAHIPRLSKLPVLLDEVSYAAQHRQVIEYAKGLDVRTLDPALASQRLDDWLRSGPAGSKTLAWGINLDCDAKSSTEPRSRRETPLCITVAFARADFEAWITIQIGTLAEGPNGKPELKSVSVQRMGADETERRTSAKLSDLLRLLAQPSFPGTDRSGD